MTRFFILLTALAVVACGSGSSTGNDLTDPGKNDVAEDVPLQPDDAAAEAAADADVMEEVLVPPVPWGPENRGFIDLRGIVHAHSIYSHDGCASDAPPIGSPESLQCLAEMRAAPCLAGIDFLMQTDHPGNVADTPFLSALHYQPGDGDELMRDGKDRVFANKVTCPADSLVDHFYFYVGAEGGSKQMPVAFAGPDDGVTPGSPEVMHTGYEDDDPLDEAQAALATLHELGGVALSPHTEEGNISVQRMIDLPLDGMEIYNFHTGILEAIDNFDKFLTLNDFMGSGGPAEPVADLAILTFLQPVELDPIKFDQAAPHIHLAHISANDVHRNVEVPALCAGGLDDGGMCQNLAAEYPHFAQFLVKGGAVPLNDSDRLDSYVRSYRWFSNHAWVAKNDPDDIRKAIGHGRGFSAFDILGFPTGFDFFAINDGVTMELGDEATLADGTVLYIRNPVLTDPPWDLERVDDFSGAQLTTKLFKATKQDSTVVLEVEGQGQTAKYEVPETGAYRVEIWMVPTHVKPGLIGVEELADADYPYLYSNAIFLR